MLTIRANNTAPVRNFAAHPAIGQREALAFVGEAFSYTIPADFFTDADGDALTYSAVFYDAEDNQIPMPGWVSFDAATRTFSGTPTKDDKGSTYVFGFIVTDGIASAADDLLVVVPNRAPVASELSAQTATIGAAFSYTLPENAFSDADGDMLTYTAMQSGSESLPAWLAFNAETRTFSGTPAVADRGSYTIRIGASDGEASASTELVITVPNRAPVPGTALAAQTANVDEPFSYTVPENAFSDPDSDGLTYTAALSNGNALPNWLTFNMMGRTSAAPRLPPERSPSA